MNQNFMPIGSIIPYVPDFKNLPPNSNWLLCDGRAIPAKYSALINLIGNNTPNLSGRTLIGVGTSNSGTTYKLGDMDGTETVQLLKEHMPKHGHTYSAMRSDIGGDYYNGDLIGYAHPNWWPLKANSDPTGIEGDDKPHNNMQPYFVITYIIYAGEI